MTVAADAAAVVAYFAANPCSTSSIAAVSTFQASYNASGLPGQLTIDGQYGPNSQAAIVNVLGSAPTNCFGGTVPTTPALDAGVPATPAPVMPGAQLPPPPPPPLPGAATTTAPTLSYVPWVIGGAVVGGTVGILYALHIHRKQRRRR